MTPRSVRAIENIRAVCEDQLKDRYELQIIDVYKQPRLATDEQIIASPTLVKRRPLPSRRMIGDLSNTDRVRTGLDLPNEQ
jgi:circadian clock protein KaiB